MPREIGDFKVREKVLVAFTDQPYEAKVVKAEKLPDSGWRYFIHYPGWAKTYDEWVPASDLIKYDPSRVTAKPTAPPPPPNTSDAGQAAANVARLHHAAADMSEAAPTPAEALSNGHQRAAMQSKPHPSDKRSKKRPRTAPDTLTNGTPDTGQALQAEIDLPPALKKILLEEHELVSQEARLPPPPHNPSTADILAQYVDFSTGQDYGSQAPEVAASIREYFDRALPHMLLYDEEVDDFEGTDEEVPPSSLYGGQHLLRFLVKLPDLLSAAHGSANSYVKLQSALVELLGYLQENARSFFPSATN